MRPGLIPSSGMASNGISEIRGGPLICDHPVKQSIKMFTIRRKSSPINNVHKLSPPSPPNKPGYTAHKLLLAFGCSSLCRRLYMMFKFLNQRCCIVLKRCCWFTVVAGLPVVDPGPVAGGEEVALVLVVHQITATRKKCFLFAREKVKYRRLQMQRKVSEMGDRKELFRES